MHMGLLLLCARVPTDAYGGGNSRPEMPYKCPTCGKTFKHMSSLMNHEADRHGDYGSSEQLRLGY